MKTRDETPRRCLVFGRFCLDPASRTLFDDGKRITLPSRAFDALVLLIENRGQVVDKKTLLDLIWPDAAVEENTLAQSVAAIRKALHETPANPGYLITVPGRGYSFVAEVSETERETAPAAQRNLRIRLAVGLMAMALVAAAAAGIWMWRSGSTPQQRVVPLTTSAGLESNPTFSPDGRQIAYTWQPDGEEYGSLYVKVIGSGQPLRITSGPASFPVWSPDGLHISYCAPLREEHSGPHRALYLIPALGGAPRKIAEVKVADRAAWFPDSKRLVFSDQDPRTGFPSIFELSIETGHRRQITAGQTSWGDMLPAVSPDGKVIAFLRGQMSGVNSVHLMPSAGGTPRQLTEPDEAAFNLAWTADGCQIVYCAKGRLWRIPASGGQPEPIEVPSDRVPEVAISGMGNRLAFTEQTQIVNLWRFPLDGSDPPRKLAPTNRRQVSPRFSSDGRMLAFGSYRTGALEIWASDPEGHNLLQVTSMAGAAQPGSPNWSPDSARIVFDARPAGNPDIYEVEVQGGPLRRLTSDPAENIIPSYSRDGRWIYFTSNRGGSFQIWKIARLGGDPVQVTAQGGAAALESPDGRYLYYVKDRAPGLWRRLVAGGVEEQVLDHVAGWQGPWFRYWGLWTLAGSAVFYLDRDFSQKPSPWIIKRFDPKTRATATLAKILKQPQLQSPAIAVTPDERFVVYVQIDEQMKNIMLLEGFR